MAPQQQHPDLPWLLQWLVLFRQRHRISALCVNRRLWIRPDHIGMLDERSGNWHAQLQRLGHRLFSWINANRRAAGALFAKRTDQGRTDQRSIRVLLYQQRRIRSVLAGQLEGHAKPHTELRPALGSPTLSRSGHSAFANRLWPESNRSGISFHRKITQSN